LSLSIKKIAIASNTSWNIYNFRMGLIKVLKEKGYEIVTIAPRDEYVRRLEQEKLSYRYITIDNKGINPFKDIYLTFDFFKIFKRERPHLILFYTIKPNIYGSIAAHFLNIPVINNITGLGTLFIKDNWLTKIAEYLYRYALRHSEKVFFQNDDDMYLFIRKKIIKKTCAERLPSSGIDHKKFAPYPIIKTNSRFTFLLSARMIWDKGIGIYVEAARIVREKYENIEFQLLGFMDVKNPAAISREKMQEWVDAGIVNYLGKTDNVIDYILKADCVVLPSFREGLPRSLLEAASLAKPIITSNCSGCRDVVDDGFNGFLCTPNNALDLAEKMECMINLSDDERSLMGRRGREKMIKEFDETIVIRRYLDIVSL
jgi:glycosyltransferase involved in cell wall biosynthesis